MFKIESRNVNFFYGETQALHDISLAMKANTVTALIGPQDVENQPICVC